MAALQLFGVLIAGFLVSSALVEPIRRFAIAKRILDYPDRSRRAHRHPVPRLGGVAVFAGFVAAVTAGLLFRGLTTGVDRTTLVHTSQLIASCAILFSIGLVDDLKGVRPLLKLLGQTLAALVLQYRWVSISTVALPPDVVISLGWAAIPVTTLWLVGMSNALNLIDGLDGVAGSVAVIALGALTASALILRNVAPPIGTIALAGALIGFLRYNLPPAKMFLGDSGSLVIGFLLAFLSIRTAQRPNGDILAIVPVFALSYPLLDTGIAMLRRWLRGHPLSRADRRHVHHQLRALGLSDRRAVMMICVYSLGVAALGLCVTFAPAAFTLGVAAAGGLILLAVFVYGVRWLEYHEFVDAAAILASAGTLARGAIRDSIHARDVGKLIQDAVSLAAIDEILRDSAHDFRFAHVQVGPCHSSSPICSRVSSPSLWKLEYPVVAPSGTGFRISGTLEESLVLTIWCAKASGVRTAHAERVAQIISESIAAWASTAPAHVAREIFVRTRTPVVAGSAVAMAAGSSAIAAVIPAAELPPRRRTPSSTPTLVPPSHATSRPGMRTGSVSMTILLLCAAALLDYVTTSELSAIVFYAIPVAFAARSRGARTGLIAAFVSTMSLAYLQTRASGYALHPGLMLWNTAAGGAALTLVALGCAAWTGVLRPSADSSVQDGATAVGD